MGISVTDGYILPYYARFCNSLNKQIFWYFFSIFIHYIVKFYIIFN